METELERLNEKEDQQVVIHYFNNNVEKKRTWTLSRKIKRRIWRIFPALCSLLLNVPYGMMFAWPSPSYPKLLLPTSQLSISLDQSAMIAGFLMIGMTVSTPFSSTKFVNTKNSMLIGIMLMFISWITLWQATNIYCLLAGRFIGGFGYGFSNVKMKIYIGEMCDRDLSKILVSLTMPSMCLGAVIMFCYGPFVQFIDLNIIASIITGSIFSLLVFLPNTPKEYIENNKLTYAKKIISSLKPQENTTNEINRLKLELAKEETQTTYLTILKTPTLRQNFFTIGCLAFLQQFTGLPPTIIYSQILFAKYKVPNPIYMAIIYVTFFLFSNLTAQFLTLNYNKRKVLLTSNLLVIIAITMNILIIYFQVNELYFSYASVIVMLFYVIAHTLGLGNIPASLIPDYFPATCRTKMAQFFVMIHSMSALVITKIFQVLMGNFGIVVPFYLFISFSLVSLVFIVVFVTEKSEKEVEAVGSINNK